MSKVFCKNCEFYKSYFDEWSDVCMNNPKKQTTHHSESNDYAYPEEKNKNNDCKEFKEKIVLSFKDKIRRFIKINLNPDLKRIR